MINRNKIDWNQELENSINLNRLAIEKKYVDVANRKLQDIYTGLFRNMQLEINNLFNKANDRGKWTRTDAIKYGRMESLLKQLGSELKVKDKVVKSLLKKSIGGIYLDDYFTMADMLNDFGIGNTVNFFKANLTTAIKNQLAQDVQGLSYLQRQSRITGNEAIQLEEQIRISQSLGEGIAQTKKRINKVSSIGLASAQRLANVTLMSASNNAHLEAYKRLKTVDFVKWSAALDSVTCVVCGTKDGRTYLLKSAPPLPIHFNCRCSWIPVVKDWDWKKAGKVQIDGATTRIARDPKAKGRFGRNIKVAGDFTYRDYFLQLPEAKQKDVLGVGKWKLWNEKKITLNQIAPGYKEKTLKSLK